MCLLYCFSKGTDIQRLVHEPVENKLYFTSESRVETYDLNSDERMAVVNISGPSRGLDVDRKSK